eukprot:UN09620
MNATKSHFKNLSTKSVNFRLLSNHNICATCFLEVLKTVLKFYLTCSTIWVI